MIQSIYFSIFFTLPSDILPSASAVIYCLLQQALMSDTPSEFASITNLFYSGQFQQGRSQLDRLIHRSPDNSILLANRALFSSQLGQDLLAIQDLEKAIELQPFNYLAYFNLFSLLTRNNEDLEAYDNLYCCLSCMYLFKAKSERSIELAEKSLEFAGDNTAARLLKIGLLREAKLFEKAAAQLKLLVKDLPNTEEGYTHQNANNMATILDSLKHRKQRLHNSIIFPPQGDLTAQINQRVKQFNTIYSELSHHMGTVTHKVPKESHLSNNIETFLKSKISSNKESVIAILEDQEFFNNHPKKSQARHPTLDTNPESMEDVLLPFPEEHAVSSYHPQVLTGKGHAESVIEEKSMECDDSRSENIKKEYEHLAAYFIYPNPGNKLLKVNLLHFKFTEPQQITLNHVYCAIQYNNTNLTSCTTQYQDQSCTWNETFPPLPLSSQPTIMKLTLYNKSLSSMLDTYLGQIQVIIDLADLLNLPIYYKDQPTGQLLLHLQLLDPQPLSND